MSTCATQKRFVLGDVHSDRVVIIVDPTTETASYYAVKKIIVIAEKNTKVENEKDSQKRTT